MERLRCLLAVLTTSVLLWALAVALPSQTNVDTREPSVIRSPASLDPGDGFGWSAVFHQREAVVDSDEPDDLLRKIRIVIGAPKGTFPGGLTTLEDYFEPAENRTGLVYSCTVRGMCVGVQGNTSLYAATEAITNGAARLGGTDDVVDFYQPELSEGRLFDQAPNTVNLGSANVFERKSGQLMGSSLYSSGDNILACAPLRNTIEGQPRGICFLGDRTLSNFKTVYPCRFRTSNQFYCLAGFSADIVNKRIALGIPGHTLFTGAIQTSVVDVDSNTLFPQFADYVFPTPSVPSNSGWQVTHGYISNNNRSLPTPDVLVSSPRHNGRGNYTGRVVMIDSSQLPFQSTTTVSGMMDGTQHAEFFGYSIAVCDLTGDGYDEVIVGAPMYTSLNPLKPELGRVYVFFNSEGSLSPDPVILEGRAPYGRFGFAVANVGDLDADGHEDFAVGAPYERMTPSSPNSGAVYVYYGRNTAVEFLNQTAQRILANDIVASVSTLASLTTFGFTLNGNMDVDDNGHQDFLASAPDTQAVIVLRTYPLVNVTVDIADVAMVNIDAANPGFDVMITATYTSTSVRDALAVRYTLMEDRVGMTSRLFFTDGVPSDSSAEGSFQFTGPDTPTMVTIRVYAIDDISELAPYQLELDLLDFDRSSVPPVSGSQELSDLSGFPRLRLLGTPNVSVPIIDPCGDMGCVSDVVLRPIIPSEKVLIAGQASSVIFNVSYENIGEEDGRSLRLAIYNLPSNIFSTVRLITIQDNGAPVTCQFEIDMDLNVTCALQMRLRANEKRSAELTFFLASTFIGVEDPFSVSMEILLDQTNMNTDTNLANNVQAIQFNVTSQSDINIAMQFSQSVYQYTSQVPNVRQGAGQFGDDVILQIDVDNSGPSVIQTARIVIMFPSRNTGITGSSFYFLYPATFTHEDVSGTMVNCTLDGLDPEGVELGQELQMGRRRRSAIPEFTTSRRERRLAGMGRPASFNEPGERRKRQDITLDCGEANCDIFTCDIQRLSTNGISFRLGAVLDERFYSTAANSRVFKVIATSVVSVTSGFQIADDVTTDNTAIAEATIRPETDPTGPDNLVHYIVWPIIGGILILVVLVIILYCVGFFRRKKKPGEDEEVEGDFNAPAETEVKAAAEPPTKGEGTTV